MFLWFFFHTTYSIWIVFALSKITFPFEYIIPVPIDNAFVSSYITKCKQKDSNLDNEAK